LYQQIVGRGLRLFEGKKDCLILDYTGVPHDIFSPQIHERRPISDAVPVKVDCPDCNHKNEFWGVIDQTGITVEHFGKTCAGLKEDPETGDLVPCGFKYRAKYCEKCGSENEMDAPRCVDCQTIFVDDESKLREALSMKNAHVMQPATMLLEKKVDKKGQERLEIRYYDLNGESLSEVYFFQNQNDPKIFYYNFIRMHHRLPEIRLAIKSIPDAISNQKLFRMPLYIIARKQDKYWKIREKIFL